MKKTVGILAAALFGAALSLAGVAPASAATPSLRFHGAQYDSPGTDNRTNASLNAEWVSLVNTGAKAVNLNGYTIRDKAGHVYKFGSVTIAAKGGRIWLHTGSGKNDAKNRYWGSKAYIWNNNGDTAYLRNAAGKQVDSCAWAYKKGRSWVGC
ncbi:lamin tail domain-containing protein [Phytohabitans rumicis]|uniref:lamin tail domain-containing protein n=1 Tax=Phytohabitans rumicis TaxID=1076125 RepID=UPI00156779BA|nr:lamin tail domain-containing protein [Phytohabitans rumicis]